MILAENKCPLRLVPTWNWHRVFFHAEMNIIYDDTCSGYKRASFKQKISCATVGGQQLRSRWVDICKLLPCILNILRYNNISMALLGTTKNFRPNARDPPRTRLNTTTNLQAKVSATVRLFGGDSSHTPFFDWQSFQKKTLVSLSNHTYGTHKCAGFWW